VKARTGFALIALWLALRTWPGPLSAKDRPKAPSPGHPCVRECKRGLQRCKLGCETSGTSAQIKNCKEQACTLLLKSCIKECTKEKSPDEQGPTDRS